MSGRIPSATSPTTLLAGRRFPFHSNRCSITYQSRIVINLNVFLVNGIVYSIRKRGLPDVVGTSV